MEENLRKMVEDYENEADSRQELTGPQDNWTSPEHADVS